MKPTAIYLLYYSFSTSKWVSSPFPFLEVINYHRFGAAIRIVKAHILKEHLHSFLPNSSEPCWITSCAGITQYVFKFC